MINKLVKYLEECDNAYYNTSNPLVSDATYDALVETLRRLDPTNPYLSKVGAKVYSDKIGRFIPMGTLSKLHKEEEVKKWMDSEGDDEFIVSPKYDGFAVELTYVDGNLMSASTRGDGFVGENILNAMMRVQSVPISVSSSSPEGTLIVRGEAIIPTKHHEAVKALGYAAMRNAVPGIVKSCRVDALGYVDFVAYEFIEPETNRESQREYYKNYFIVEDYKVFNKKDFDKILSYREGLREGNYLYELDGVVLKTVKMKLDDLLHPDHMVSWKYKSNRESTILRDVEFSMGVSGYFTPIGIFDEVEFQGAKLTRASLGNITRMYDEFFGLRVGSIIEVSRRGDIIPYIEEMIYEGDGELIETPEVCPHCGESLAIDKDEPHCVNKSCPEKLRLQISQFVKSVGIKGIGDALIKGLINAKYVNTLIDVYNMNPESILQIPRQGESAVLKWRSFQEKKLSPSELLTAYPFLDLGKKIWDTVLTKYTFREILDLTSDELANAKLKGLGEGKRESIISQVKENREELAWLGEYHGLL